MPSPLYQLGDDLAFERCLPDTLKEEGGYSNDAHDPGGMTMDGIIQREYDKWRIARGLPTRWVAKISPDEMRTIYHDEYWVAAKCAKCPAGLDLCLFDAAVNMGVHVGIMLLQQALGIADDGAWGPQTDLAVSTLRLANNSRNISLAIMAYYSARRTRYKRTRNFQYFGKDWLHRDLDIEQEALAMAPRLA